MSVAGGLPYPTDRTGIYHVPLFALVLLLIAGSQALASRIGGCLLAAALAVLLWLAARLADWGLVQAVFVPDPAACRSASARRRRSLFSLLAGSTPERAPARHAC